MDQTIGSTTRTKNPGNSERNGKSQGNKRCGEGKKCGRNPAAKRTFAKAKRKGKDINYKKVDLY